MKLHAYEQSSNVPNGVPLDDTIDTANLKEFEMSVFAMEELDHSPQQLERQFEQFSIQDGEDNEDGTNRAQGSDNSKQVGISYTSMSMPYVIHSYINMSPVRTEWSILSENVCEILDLTGTSVTLSVYPHRASLKNMPGHGGNQTYDLWNTSPMLCQLSYAVRSVQVCDISEPNLVPSISM